jgi:hypothetical protein
MKIKTILSFTIAVVLLFTSCQRDNTIITNCTQGEGTIITATVAVNNFTKIDLAFASDVTVSQGAIQEVSVTGHPNIINKINKDVVNGLFILQLENGCYNNYQLSFHITIPNLDQLILSGSGNMVVNNFTNQGDLSIDLNGSGNMTINGFEGTENLSLDIAGSGNITANTNITTLRTLTLDLAGSGTYNGFPLNGKDCVVDLTGSGNIELAASNTLEVTIDGSGNVSYKGTPTITQNISGSGSLINAN